MKAGNDGASGDALATRAGSSDGTETAEGWRAPARAALRAVDRLNAALTGLVGLPLGIVTAALLGQVLVRALHQPPRQRLERQPSG